MEKEFDIVLQVRRYDPESQHKWIQEYKLRVGGIVRFVDLFRQINDEQDPGFTWNSSCEHGQCGTCSVRINGKPMLACELLVENAVAEFKTTVFTIQPLSIAPVIRDLVIDIEKAYRRIDRVKPYLIDPVTPAHQDHINRIPPDRLSFFVSATRCINCFCCADACLSNHRSFLGPNAMLAAIVRAMDPREKARAERLNTLYRHDGVYRCHTSMACSCVCPKEIDVAHFIALAKQGRFDN